MKIAYRSLLFGLYLGATVINLAVWYTLLSGVDPLTLITVLLSGGAGGATMLYAVLLLLSGALAVLHSRLVAPSRITNITCVVLGSVAALLALLAFQVWIWGLYILAVVLLLLSLRQEWRSA
jgi:hypothetical protein